MILVFLTDLYQKNCSRRILFDLEKKDRTPYEKNPKPVLRQFFLLQIVKKGPTSLDFIISSLVG
jgi:hypothetical protein